MEKRRGKILLLLLSVGFLFSLFASPLPAQEFPTRPINALVAVSPGSTLDVTTRLIMNKAEKMLGQPFIVTNNGAGGGAVALGITAKEKPDGYHLTSIGSDMLVLVPQVRRVSYRHQDFEPIMHFGAPQFGLAVRADSPWKTLKEFVEYAKKNPGKVTYGSMDVGTIMHMAMETIAKQEGVRWTLVPYTASGTATTALLGGHITAESGNGARFLPHVKAGTLRMLATYGEKRMVGAPDVPTLGELGYDFRVSVLYMLAAPKGTPLPMVKKLDDAFHKALADPEVHSTLNRFEVQMTYRNSEDLKKYLDDTHLRFGAIVKEFNIPREAEKNQ